MTEPNSDLNESPAAVDPIESPKQAAAQKRHVDKQLDHGLDETFPASDPVSINPGSD